MRIFKGLHRNANSSTPPCNPGELNQVQVTARAKFILTCTRTRIGGSKLVPWTWPFLSELVPRQEFIHKGLSISILGLFSWKWTWFPYLRICSHKSRIGPRASALRAKSCLSHWTILILTMKCVWRQLFIFFIHGSYRKPRPVTSTC